MGYQGKEKQAQYRKTKGRACACGNPAIKWTSGDFVCERCDSLEKHQSKSPNPGSDDAIRMGCKCPVMDNDYGHGYCGRKGVFVMTENCPVHGKKSRRT